MPQVSGNVWALTLVRIGVAVFFIFFGALKLFGMGPDATAAMMESTLGLSGAIGAVAAWLVIIAELFGGIVILLGAMMPKQFYQFSLGVLVLITVVGFFGAHAPKEMSEMLKELFWHLQIALAMLGLMMSEPKCAFGITGGQTDELS